MTDTTAEISINDKDVREELSGTVSGASAASITKNQTMPSVDAWLKEAKNDENAGRIGMYLTHNGVVRSTAKAASWPAGRTLRVRNAVYPGCLGS